MYYMRNGNTRSCGAILVVGDSAKSPRILSKGIFVTPGAETNIGLHKKIISRLPEPYDSNCTHTYLNETIGNFSGSKFEYSSQSCEALCYGIRLYDACQCIYHALVEGLHIEQWFKLTQSRMKICNITPASDDWNCIMKYPNKYFDGSSNCDCNPNCIEETYYVS